MGKVHGDKRFFHAGAGPRDHDGLLDASRKVEVEAGPQVPKHFNCEVRRLLVCEYSEVLLTFIGALAVIERLIPSLLLCRERHASKYRQPGLLDGVSGLNTAVNRTPDEDNHHAREAAQQSAQSSDQCLARRDRCTRRQSPCR